MNFNDLNDLTQYPCYSEEGSVVNPAVILRLRLEISFHCKRNRTEIRSDYISFLSATKRGD